MPYVMRIVGLVRGGATPHDGRYVVEFDAGPVGLPLGECVLRTSRNIEHARRYATREDAHYAWRSMDIREPTRPDGRPNRPLTVFSVEILAV